MGKTRQAVKYERLLSDAQVKAHIELTKTQLKAERKLTEQAVAYERKYTDGQFGQLNLVAQDHRLFHEREHLLYEDAIEKAATALSATMASLETDMQRFREEAGKWMTVERFEREHTALEDKLALAVANLGEKVNAEEKVTLRQTTKDEVVSSIAANAQTTRRWMIGILVTLTIFGITTLIGIATTALHAFKVI